MTPLAVLKLLAIAVQILYEDAARRTEARDLLVWDACLRPGGDA